MNGTLPKEGTVCQTESSIFGETLDLAKTLDAGDNILLHAAEELRKMNIVPRLFDVSQATHTGWESLGQVEDNHSKSRDCVTHG